MTTIMQPPQDPSLPNGTSAISPISPRHESHGSPPDDSHDDEGGRGRRRSRSEAGDDDGAPGHSEGPTRKRRRSRKGLDKKFLCPHDGCGKTYSRAEHLYRHQLNHNPKQIYACDYPDCTRTFVRLDLCNRHKDRHTARGSHMFRKDSIHSTNQTPSGPSQPGQVPPLQTQTQAQMQMHMPMQMQMQHHVSTNPMQTQLSGSTSRPMQNQMHSGTPSSQISGSMGTGMMGSGQNMPPPTPNVSHALTDSISPTTTAPSAFTPTDSITSESQRPALFTNPTTGPVNPVRRAMMPTHGMTSASHPMPFPASAPLHPVDSPYGNMMMIGGRRMPQPATIHSPNSMVPQSGPSTNGMNVNNFHVMSPVSTASSFPVPAPRSAPQHPVLLPNQSFPPCNLPSSNFNNGETSSDVMGFNGTQGELSGGLCGQPELMMLDAMQTYPMFGSENLMNKSPYVSMPTDLINYLFSEQSPVNQAMAYQNGGYSSYSQMYMGPPGNTFGYMPNLQTQVMAVNNLLERNLPEATISDAKSQEIFDFVKQRFVERGEVPEDRKGEDLIAGDRSQPTHMFSKRMMQAFIGSYWLHFSDQIPVLHKPTFSPDQTPCLLLLSMMAIGAAFLDKMTHGDRITNIGAQLSNFLAWHIRWEMFMDKHFQAPAKLWAFQAMLLLEIYEKMYSTQELHERASVHHATTIAMMRRGRALVWKSVSADSPSELAAGRRSRQSSTPGPGTADDWWNHWIINESTRRTAFAAFLIDSIHCKMFGHSSVMVAHELRLPLPCDEALWRATSGSEVGRLETVAASNGFKALSFLEALRKTLQGGEVQTNAFGRMVLMAGMLNVSWHMEQRDLQVNMLGSGIQATLGGRDKWRMTLTTAFDTWNANFSKTHGDDPYGSLDPSRRQEITTNLQSRTVLHHLAHIALHVDVIDCQIYARSKRLLGRGISESDLRSAQRRMRDKWVQSARARDAMWYAVDFLCTVLIPADRGLPRGPGFNPDDPYNARDDVLLNRPWVVFLASLVVWCYGHASEGRCAEQDIPKNHGEAVAQMRDYLIRFGSISSPSELQGMKGLNNTTGLLMVLRKSFDETRWALLRDGSKLLNNCIDLNTGAMQ